MAISTPSVNLEKSVLEISASEFYFDKMRPYLQDMIATCNTDPELVRTLYKVINASDSFCQRKEYEKVAESFDVLERVISDKNYFNGVMQKAPEEEKQKVRDLITKISDLRMVIKCEQPLEKQEEPIKERIGYNVNSKENEDFSNRNIKELIKPIPKNRIPNV